MAINDDAKKSMGKMIEIELSINSVRYEGEIRRVNETTKASYITISRLDEKGEVWETSIRTDIIKNYRIYDKEEV